MKITEFFRNIFGKTNNNKILTSPEIDYEKKSASIDGLELSKMLIDAVTPTLKNKRQQYGDYDSPLQTKISVADTRELVKKFFADIDTNLYKKVCDIDADKSPYAVIDRNYQGSHGETSYPSQFPVTVLLPIFGDLRQLYVAVHEITHTLDIENGETTTRRILGEIAPQCMERMLDDFLLNLSDSDMKKYGFDKNTLKQDITKRKITTFYDRLRITESLYYGRGNKEMNLRYMLAQIFSTHFYLYEKHNKKAKIKSLIDYVQADDFEGAYSCFGMQIKKGNDFQRRNYIRDTISAVEMLINPQKHIDNVTQENQQIDNQDIIKQ